ncbi:cytochrome bd-I oxidase subunit CydX [Thorsellia kenyensis]|uniref:Cytochrome bd-I oxidase subunit CydX n=1 Tax=Thorsellia kenyensis TaxID=1549888 RepID=A0ABV6C757_9GAMM
MWYFAWILGTLLACCLSIITGLALEHLENSKEEEEKKQ